MGPLVKIKSNLMMEKLACTIYFEMLVQHEAYPKSCFSMGFQDYTSVFTV